MPIDSTMIARSRASSAASLRASHARRRMAWPVLAGCLPGRPRAAVDGEHLRGDLPGGGGGEEEYRVGDVVRAAGSSGLGSGDEIVAAGAGQAIAEILGVSGVTGRDHVRGDAAGAEIGGEAD